MPYAVAIKNFEGPFDLLLQLVEAEKLDITDISLVQVTEPFLTYLAERRGALPPEELADFLVIAAKLVYLKSKAIVPGLTEAEMEEGPDLASQLRAYQAFVAASKHIQMLAAEGGRSFGRTRHVLKAEPGTFSAPPLVPEDVHGLFTRLLRRLEPLTRLPQAAMERVMTLEEKMSELLARTERALRTSFRIVAKEAKNRAELIITFLAILELAKQRTIEVRQTELFEDINIAKL